MRPQPCPETVVIQLELRSLTSHGNAAPYGRQNPTSKYGLLFHQTFMSLVVVPHNLIRANWLMVLMGWR